ncbi:MAG: transcriptional regulator [Alphaproteobacteria bacterium]|nr:transcriptional regulator [Alphaproteobacteria bacterium]
MSPSHHPADDILTAYAAGALESGFGLVVGAHVEMCPACRRRLGALEAASGDALADLPGAALAADAYAQTVARLDGVETHAPVADRRPLLERLPLSKKKWIAPGVWVSAVKTPHAADDRVYVLHVGPGRPTARHTHLGAEFCTVLSGSYRDELGVFRAGDFAAADGALEHQPLVAGDEACVCLFATEGRLQAKDWVGRLAFAYADV